MLLLGCTIQLWTMQLCYWGWSSRQPISLCHTYTHCPLCPETGVHTNTPRHSQHSCKQCWSSSSQRRRRQILKYVIATAWIINPWKSNFAVFFSSLNVFSLQQGMIIFESVFVFDWNSLISVSELAMMAVMTTLLLSCNFMLSSYKK